MKINYYVIAMLVCVVLAILSACLIAVWSGCGIFLGFFLLCFSVLYSFRCYVAYKKLVSSIDEQRYCDAYLYADENNVNFDVENFRYSKHEERVLKRMRRNKLVPFIAGICLAILSIVIIYIGFSSVL